jgi:hypothetical protein
MARRHRQDPALPLEAPVRVRLKDDERELKQHQLTVKIQALRMTKREALGKARDYRAEVDRLEGDINTLADALQADEELRKQGELFVSPDAATSTLAGVAAAVGEGARVHLFAAPAEAPTDGTAPRCATCNKPSDDPGHAKDPAFDFGPDEAPPPNGDDPEPAPVGA